MRWRHSQIGKAVVCKTMYSRFESGCRLHIYSFGNELPALVSGSAQANPVPDRRASGGMVYTADLKSAALTGLRVRIPPRLPFPVPRGQAREVKVWRTSSS